MNKRTITSALFGAAILFSGMGSASAAYSGPCATEFTALEYAIHNGVFLGARASTDQTNLLAKLSAAEAKVTATPPKYSDAIDKLQDISDTATALAGAPKPKLQDATAINNAVINAMTCVAGLH